MITTDLPTADAFVGALAEHGLLSGAFLERAKAWRRAFPDAGADELAKFLVEENHITRFQADTLLEGDPKTLNLSVYTLVDILGTGSMGTVFKARSSKDDNWYAIKVVPRRNVINLKSITEKVEALKQIRHPRVSAMVHVGAQGDRAYMVWPMIEGGDKLDSVVKKHGRLAPKAAAQVALQIAAGLQAYHAHDLFHGLLKPSDIVIGADRRARILDFGVGFLLTCERGKALLDTMTNSRALARGLDCASPEAILDPLNRTVLGDQYSLGCILYYCLTGRYPFNEANPVKKMLAHQHQEPTPIRELVPDCPPRLEAILNQLLEKLPEYRYPTIDALISDLQLVTSDTRPRPVAATVKTIPAVDRRPADADNSEESPEESSESMKQNNQATLWLTLAGMAAGGLGGLLAWLMTRT
jgi:serine/threonine-protein kinase